ncbi:MAG: crosslink repair DNA glycosylase YcaQ family protein [Planctomycetota bacterium]
MPSRTEPYSVELESVLRLWLYRQGLAGAAPARLSRDAFVDHLERCGGLQMDSVNVVDRAHYLTLWSRFGSYDRRQVDAWIYEDRVAYEYWGHEASVLAASRLPRSLRHMRRFRPEGPWWSERLPGRSSVRRVLRRLREEGPLESKDFEKRPGESGAWWDWKEDKRALELLWHRGRVATSRRNHFRRAYDLAERVYGDVLPESLTEYQDGWLLDGLSGNGIASERHLTNYVTAPRLLAQERAQIIQRNLRSGRVVRVSVKGRDDTYLALPEALEGIDALEEARGTRLICPFDSLLWQRDRAHELLDFHYRIEIYLPPKQRTFGYYVLPILHDGRLVGRLDPKLHRDQGRLEIKSIHLEPGFQRTKRFERALAGTLRGLADFLAAKEVELPRDWRQLPH